MRVRSRQPDEAPPAKSEFFSKMSHELRTPLNSMIGFSELLLAGSAGELNDQQRRYVGDIESSARELLVLVNDLVEFSKLQAGRAELASERVDVVLLVEDIVRAMGPAAAARQIAVVTSLPREAWCTTDRRRAAQVLGILVSQTIEVTRSGGRIDVRALVDGERIAIVVDGSGPGIAADALPHAFEPFSRTGVTARGELGLAIVEALVAQLGGTVTAENQPDRGTTFHFTLPSLESAKAALPSTPPASEQPPASEAPRSAAGAKVVVVDDNPMNRRVAMAMLHAEGIEVVQAGSAAEGLELARRIAPDVVLMDMSLPDMDGAEATRLLLADERTRDIAIIGVSAHAAEEDAARARAAGCAAYVTKPIARRALLDAVGAAVHERRRRANGSR